ncbi:MAG: IclR family transcriptional regulator [Lautropia sp.]
MKKALSAVQLVALRGELTIREIGATLGIPKSTAHRLVSSLVDVRLLEAHRRPEGDVYVLGRLIGELSGGHYFWRPIVQHARPELTALRDELGETFGIHVLFGECRVLLDQCVSEHPHRWVYDHQMVPRPLYAGAAAKMLLALLEEKDVLRLIRQSRASPGSRGQGFPEPDALIRNLREIRRLCYSRSSEEINPGINSLSVPVIARAQGHLPLTVISMAGPSIRLTDKVMARCLPRMVRAAARIAGALQRPAIQSRQLEAIG